MGDSGPSKGRAAPKPKLPRRWRWGWPLLLLGLAAAIPLLVWQGWLAISSSSDGTEVGAPVDPTAPGFLAFVDPTPTLLLIHANGDRLHGVTLLALTDPGVEGAVLFLAPETMTSDGLLSVHWAESATAGVSDAVAELLGIRTSERQVVDDAGWAALTSAVAPIAVESPDALVSAGGERRFEAGTLALAADVGPFLSWRNPGESPMAALFRHEQFWDAWLGQVAASSAPNVIPGEVDRGMGRFGRALAMGRLRLEVLPGVADASGAVLLDEDAVAEVLNEAIPFPISVSNGSLPAVRLLNGTDDPGLTKTAARALRRSGARITLIGNAAEFGWETTTVAYHDTGFASHAQVYRDALGTGSVVAEEVPNAAVDITVTFGADFSQTLESGG